MAYVPETRFGEWFQRSTIWRQYVVEEAVAELLSLLPAPRPHFPVVLDAGCGEGVALDLLQRELRPDTLLGLDLNPQAVRASAHATYQLATPKLLMADGARLPLPDGAIDLVFCHQLLHHCEDPVTVLSELYRITRPGGWLLVAESCRQFLDWWPVRLLFRHPARQQQTSSEYVEMIRAAGYRVTDDCILRSAPWWSQRDLGLWSRFGWGAAAPPDLQVRVAAWKEDQSATEAFRTPL